MLLRALRSLGLAYAGSNREDVLTLLLPVMGDSKSSMEVGSEAGGGCMGSRGPARALTAPGGARAAHSPFGLRVFLPGTVLCQITSLFSPSEPLVGCGRLGSRRVSEIPNFWRDPRVFCALPERTASPPLLQVAGVTALACGMISVGSCNGDVTSTILQTIMEKSETELKDTYARWLPLGLGLNHLGKGGQRRPPPGLGPGSSSTPQPQGSHPILPRRERRGDRGHPGGAGGGVRALPQLRQHPGGHLRLCG